MKGDDKRLKGTLRDLKQEWEDGPSKMLVETEYPAAVFQRRGNPIEREPDFLYCHNDKILGVEATTVGYSDEFLRREFKVLACVRQKVIFRDVPRSYIWKRPFDEQLLESLQGALDKKLRKSYRGIDELMICIYVRATTTLRDELGDLICQLKIPRPNFPGTKVFALCRTHDSPSLGLSKYMLPQYSAFD
jgi:hypothetical protein